MIIASLNVSMVIESSGVVVTGCKFRFCALTVGLWKVRVLNLVDPVAAMSKPQGDVVLLLWVQTPFKVVSSTIKHHF